MPLFPEREKVRGPAFGREPCIDDRLPWSCALAKEKMPAEWLLNSKLGSLEILSYRRFIPCSIPFIFKQYTRRSKAQEEATGGPQLKTKLNSQSVMVPREDK